MERSDFEMRQQFGKLCALVLALALVCALAGCGKTPAPGSSGEEAPEDSTPVRVMVLNGTTGFGMAKLISDAGAGEAALEYQFSVEADASNVTAALINGTADIAALPTNAAGVVYNKTEGGVQVLALNTLGVLYLVSDGTVDAASFDDLKGQTVYVPAQNPTFIFQYLCEQNGLTVGKDVIIDNTYAQPADLRTAVAAGEVSLAVLPEPMLTIAMSGNEALQVEMDLTEQWDAVAPAGSLVQGCVVVRTEFAREHPDLVETFLGEYGASIAYLSEEGADVAGVIEGSGVFTNGAVAAKALPGCNLCFITGEDMQSAMAEFLEIMYETAPDSIGGALPGDDFYYLG